MINLQSHRPWLVIFYLIVVFSSSMFTFIDIPIKNIWKYDKIIHFSEYFILGVLLFYALYEKPIINKDVYTAILIMSLIPIVDESIQYFTPNRVPSFYDAVADYLGFYTGCYIFKLIYRAKHG